MHALLCKDARHDVAIPAATPVTIDIPIHHARDWTVVVKNTGANAITALSVAVSPLGSVFEPLVAVTGGIPLAAGDSLAAIRGTSEPVETLRIVVTSTDGTAVTYEAAGR